MSRAGANKLREAREADAGPAARVMVATPAYTCQTHYRYTESLMAAQLHCAFHRVQLELRIAGRFTLVQFARNFLAQQFLDDPSFTHILWIDSDLGFDPRAVMQLLSRGKDVVGGVYPVKTMPPWFPFEHTGRSDGELLEAKTLPAGFLLVSRRAMEAVAAAAPLYTLHHEGREIPCRHIFDLELVDNAKTGRRDLLGEDVVLCHRLREAGFDVWADPDIGFRHCGMYEWTGNLQRTLEREGAA